MEWQTVAMMAPAATLPTTGMKDRPLAAKNFAIAITVCDFLHTVQLFLCITKSCAIWLQIHCDGGNSMRNTSAQSWLSNGKRLFAKNSLRGKRLSVIIMLLQ